MAVSVARVKMAILLVAFLALTSPTFSSSSLQNPNPENSSDESQESPDWFFGLKKCRHVLREQMVDRVLDHIHVSHGIKSFLKWDVKFINCVVGKFCYCTKLRFEPLIFGCFAAVGGYCMVTSFKGLDTACALDCVDRITTDLESNSKAISDICFSKCAKK